MISALILRCVTINLGIPDARFNVRFCIAAFAALHRNIGFPRDKMPQLSHTATLR
ncbi:MAG: hypothetical protein OJF48_000571 [Afipia sp.]|nr:MAG: hypothetical protein OJF48_000571 [Afipia sp.]